jgi:hypothetical protein
MKHDSADARPTEAAPREPKDEDAMCEEACDPWCKDFTGHAAAHEFCDDHQCMWCRKCDKGCPDCVDDPHCRWCHCALFEDYHDWDCPIGDDDVD